MTRLVRGYGARLELLLRPHREGLAPSLQCVVDSAGVWR